MTPFLTFIIALLIGYYARQLYDKVNYIYQDWHELQEAKKAGVVRPTRMKATKAQPIDLGTDSGPVKRMSPAQLEEERQEERAKILQEAHR